MIETVWGLIFCTLIIIGAWRGRDDGGGGDPGTYGTFNDSSG